MVGCNWKHFKLVDFYSVFCLFASIELVYMIRRPESFSFSGGLFYSISTQNWFEFYFPISIAHLIANCVQMTRRAFRATSESNAFTRRRSLVFLMLMKLNSVWCVRSILAFIFRWMRMHFMDTQQALVRGKQRMPLGVCCFHVQLFVFILLVDRSISAQIIHARKDTSAATMEMIFHAIVPKDEMVPIAVKFHER